MTERVATASIGTADAGSWPDQLAAELRREFPGLELHVALANSGILTLTKVIAPRRGDGIGSAVLARLCAEADQRAVSVACTPSSDFGGSVKRLKTFYRRFGFRPNKGANRDYATQESFLRPPCAR